MPLLGQAAMLLSFDIAAEAIAEHDDWHTHEHLPERLAIPGFLRGMRRGFCSVTASIGFGVGHLGLLVRLKPHGAAEAQLRAWLAGKVLAPLPSKAGIGSVHFLEGASEHGAVGVHAATYRMDYSLSHDEINA